MHGFIQITLHAYNIVYSMLVKINNTYDIRLYALELSEPLRKHQTYYVLEGGLLNSLSHNHYHFVSGVSGLLTVEFLCI